MKNEYLPFARKWRPQQFDDLIGQSHVAKTLKNAIDQNRVANAYLFTGPRGVGKTSTARILSKALNCETGPTPAPCNKCTNCTEITASKSLDVIEIDGASNRGIDEIRGLRENVKFSPVKSRYKIYIIDEVHMLTQEAFNALLKTLEEPPEHVKFIFATTQPYKVLATIRSRCQRFDFVRLPLKEIIVKLEIIIKKEKLKISEEVPYLIAKASQGSLRDAEVILDQLAAMSKEKITKQDVSALLGIVSQEIIEKLAISIIEKNPEAGLDTINNIINEGKDIGLCLDELLQFFRDLLIINTVKDPGHLIQQPEEIVNALTEIAKAIQKEEIIYIFHNLSTVKDMIKRSNAPRLLFETAIIKLGNRASVASAETIIERLSALEKRISSIASAPSADLPPGNSYPPATKSSAAKPVKKISASVAAKKTAPNNKDRADAEHEQVSEPAKTDNTKTQTAITEEPVASLEDIKLNWPDTVHSLKKTKMSWGTYLSEGTPVSIDGNTLTLAFQLKHKFHREVLEEKNIKKQIETLLLEITGMPLLLKFTEIVPKQKEADNTSSNKWYDPKDPAFNSVMDIFGGKIVDDF